MERRRVDNWPGRTRFAGLVREIKDRMARDEAARELSNLEKKLQKSKLLIGGNTSIYQINFLIEFCHRMT